jgi:V/A-type H+-transporting ATPase subunit D
MLGGGSAALANAEAMIGAAADVRIPWRSSMGLAYPGETETRLPDPVPLSALGRTSCLPFAAVAYRRAVEAAARHASVEHALRVVRRELAATQRRRRAISHRLIPRLEAAWADLEQRLDELDRDDMVRARWVSERTGTGRAVIRAGEGEAR